MKALDYFPLESPRETQVRVISEIEKAYSNGYRFVILEAPVGSGKSAIAITMSRLFGNSHIITPRKSLQDQYFFDFKDHIVMMKGRSAYPCSRDFSLDIRNNINKLIRAGGVKHPGLDQKACSEGDCLPDRIEILKACTGIAECPYHVAIKVAQESPHIVHNMHSFIYQQSMADKFGPRELMVIDEAHEVEGTIRDFLIGKIGIPKILPEEAKPTNCKTLADWVDWLKGISYLYSDKKIGSSPEEVTPRQAYLDRIRKIETAYDIYKNSVFSYEEDTLRKISKVTIVPVNIGQQANGMLFSHAKKILLMSGTIYSKQVFCKTLGINVDEAYFLRVDSSFPVASRPIYMKKEYMVNTSHASWEESKPKLREIIIKVLETFPDVKGLLHSPSYAASREIITLMNNKRLITHDRDNFFSVFDKFVSATDNSVLVSPICQQGIDLKDDRARFQMILRLPYPNVNDPFVTHKFKTDYPWFNHQALVIFGQQIGRINRSESDFGVTILIDDRFHKFINKNKKLIPAWVQKAIIT